MKSFACSFEECFEAVLELTREDLTAQPPRAKSFTLFIKNQKRKMLVLMGGPVSIDTTEIGVFFESIESRLTRVEISSLSKTAKIKAAEIIFAHLSEKLTQPKSAE